MTNNLERAIGVNMTNVAVIGAIQSALLRTLVAQKIVTPEMWDCLFAQAEQELRHTADDRPHEVNRALQALRKVRDRERPSV